MMFQNKGLCLLGMAGALVAADASAVVLAEYRFTGNSLAASNVDPAINASAATYQPWLDNSLYVTVTTPDVTGEAFTASTNATNQSAGTGSALLSDAVTADNYLGFTLTGTDFTITKIIFDYSVSSSQTVTFGSDVITDASGSATQQRTEFTVNGSDSAPAPGVEATANTPSDWQNLSSIDVRIYLSDSTFTNVGSHSIDNIIIEGIVPEPGTIALMAMGGLCLVRRGRRHD